MLLDLVDRRLPVERLQVGHFEAERFAGAELDGIDQAGKAGGGDIGFHLGVQFIGQILRVAGQLGELCGVELEGDAHQPGEFFQHLGGTTGLVLDILRQAVEGGVQRIGAVIHL